MRPCLAQAFHFWDSAVTAETLFLALLWIAGVTVLATTAYALLSLPHRRLERARMFLDLVGSGLARGRKPEETIREIAGWRDRELGVHFHLLAAHLEKGLGLGEAIERVPGLLPPQVQAGLRAGMEAGRLPEVIPACQEMLKDGPAKTQHVIHYLIFLFTAGTPCLFAVLVMLQVFVVPKFALLLDDLGEGRSGPPDLSLLKVATILGSVLVVINLLIVLGILVHSLGPQLRRWLNGRVPPVGDFLAFAIPWKRMRMLRDFTGTLALLLDARVPEERALKLAADTTANACYRRRALEAMAELRQGQGLVTALAGFDPTGELRWRISNATMGGQPFALALRGWREALQAHAFRAEQSSAHLITSALVLLNGLMVALVVVTLFGTLVKIIDAAALW